MLEPSATSLPAPGHLGNATGRPTPSRGRRVCKVLWTLQQFAHFSRTHRFSVFLTLSIHWSSPFLQHHKPRDSTASESSNSIINFPFRHSPFLKAQHVGWFSLPEALVRFGFPLRRDFLLGELDGEPFPFPLDSRFFSRSCVISHFSPREH